MKPHDILFWIAIGILVGALLILVGNQILLSLLRVTVTVKPG